MIYYYLLLFELLNISYIYFMIIRILQDKHKLLDTLSPNK